MPEKDEKDVKAVLDSNSSRDSADPNHDKAHRVLCDPALEPLLKLGHY